ncbi:glycosyltransferase [Chloroflexota bacterium]
MKKNFDIIAGIPSYNNQDTISYVTEQIGKTFENHYKDKKCIIADCDGGSTDKTLNNFLNSKTKIKKIVISAKPGTTGKGTVFKNLFKYAKNATAKTIIVNDSDLRSINPKWVKLQIESIKKYDYATPYYSRYKYDGQITNHLCYPLICGLFCRDIRQPIGGDFAFSQKLSNYWLKCKWAPNAKLFGIDIFMTTNSILGNFKICQVNLKSKIHDAKDPAKTLGPMFTQVLSTFFDIIINNNEKLKKFKKVEKVPLLGSKELGKPQEFSVDTQNIKKSFITGFNKNEKNMKKILQKEDYNKIQGIAHRENVSISADWWAKLVYDFIIAYKKQKGSNFVLQSFIPLWFGRIYTFINETIDMDTKEAEILIKKQAKEFFKQRDYLLEKL